MKVHILYKYVEGPWGGGNQFLKALRKKFMQIGVYEESTADADVVLFNSHHELSHVAKLKLQFPNKVFVHRLDGPIFVVRGRDAEIDKIIFNFNQSIADAIIFQSEWSRKKCFELGMKPINHETVIINAPDPSIFKLSMHNRSLKEEQKVRLIATSWSANPKKGFDIYSFLDQYLDYSRFEMTFVGNAPMIFKNINHIKPLDSERLAAKLLEHDIFIIGSVDDPCSNSLIEALHCGLPAVARNSGGHPEIIGNGGIAFNGTDDVLSAIDTVTHNLEVYRDAIKLPDISEVAQMYCSFSKTVYEGCRENICKIKNYGTFKCWQLLAQLYLWKYRGLVRNGVGKIIRVIH